MNDSTTTLDCFAVGRVLARCKDHGSEEDLGTSHQCLLYLKDVITRLPRQCEEKRSTLVPISFSTRELKMAEKVVDEEEFEFDKRAVEGGLLHLFLFFFCLHTFWFTFWDAAACFAQ